MSDPIALEKLNERIGRGWRLGLEGMRSFLERNPIEYPVILVGGTNGKGSVCKFLHDYFFAEGLRTGLTTSPHLCDVRERIVVDKELIGAADFERMFALADDDATYFETLAMMALMYFKEKAVDLAVIEIGMGGRLDAFNAVAPALSVIASIGLEHTEWLGETIEKIAVEKAAISRAGRVTVLGCNEPSLISNVIATGAMPLVAPKEADFRKQNQATARLAAREYCLISGRDFDEERFDEVSASSKWPGRFEIIAGSPEIILDAAHNEPAASALALVLAAHANGRKVVALCAFLRDKNVDGFFRALNEVVDEWVITEVEDPRALRASDVPIEGERFIDPIEGFARSQKLAGPRGVVLVTGSIYLLGEILRSPSFKVPGT